MSPPPASRSWMVRSTAISLVASRKGTPAAGEPQLDGAIDGDLARGEPEGRPGRHAVDFPGTGERLALDAHRLGIELVGAAGRRRHRGDEELGDAQILEGPVAPERLPR